MIVPIGLTKQYMDMEIQYKLCIAHLPLLMFQLHVSRTSIFGKAFEY